MTRSSGYTGHCSVVELKLTSLHTFSRENLIRSCWTQQSDKRPRASEIVEFLANKPRIISPCIDNVPTLSVPHTDDNTFGMFSEGINKKQYYFEGCLFHFFCSYSLLTPNSTYCSHLCCRSDEKILYDCPAKNTVIATERRPYVGRPIRSAPAIFEQPVAGQR